MRHVLKKAFSVIELLVVIAVVGILALVIVSKLNNARELSRNARMVSTVRGIHASVDASKYPNSLENLCFDFEPGGEFAGIRATVESAGGIWNCDSTVDAYRVFIKLNQGVVLGSLFDKISKTAFAQLDDSSLHNFGNFYCVNSDFENNYTHWSGENLTYPSCNDEDYNGTTQDPEPTPEPTPDPDPESDPDPPAEDGGPTCPVNKSEVCHFGKTLCISNKAVKAHTKHGDTEGPC